MLYTPLKSNIYLSGMSCISCKEIALLTIINLKNANFSGAPPLAGSGPCWGLPPNPPAVLPSLCSLRLGFFATLRRSSSFFINFCSHGWVKLAMSKHQLAGTLEIKTDTSRKSKVFRIC